jgi:hypothetical protein
MKISTVVDLELLRRYAEFGQWSTATELYFNACLDGIDSARLEELHEAVWARDGRAVTRVIGRLAGATRLLVSHAKVKPLPPRTERLRGGGRVSLPDRSRSTSS